MDSMIYVKKQSAALDEDFAQSARYGKVALGKQQIFWKKGLRWYTLPASEVVRAWRRVEAVSARTCCASEDFSIHTLMLALRDGSVVEVLIGDDFHRHEPERLSEEMRLRWPEIVYQKPEK